MVQVIILAGGMGKRMKSSLPKVLVEFKKKPMIIHVIEQADLLHPIKIVIVVGKNTSQLIQETIQKWNAAYIHKIKFVLQEPALGTGHAVHSCLKELEPDNQTIILSGDVPNINSETLRECFYLHTKMTSAYILGFIPANNYGYGRILCEKESLVGIREEKECNEEEKTITLCNSGIYCIPARLLIKYIPKITNNNSSGEYYLPDIFNFIVEDEPSSVNISTLPKEKNAELSGINTLEQLKQLEDTC